MGNEGRTSNQHDDVALSALAVAEEALAAQEQGGEDEGGDDTRRLLSETHDDDPFAEAFPNQVRSQRDFTKMSQALAKKRKETLAEIEARERRYQESLENGVPTLIDKLVAGIEARLGRAPAAARDPYEDFDEPPARGRQQAPPPDDDDDLFGGEGDEDEAELSPAQIKRFKQLQKSNKELRDMVQQVANGLQGQQYDSGLIRLLISRTNAGEPVPSDEAFERAMDRPDAHRFLNHPALLLKAADAEQKRLDERAGRYRDEGRNLEREDLRKRGKEIIESARGRRTGTAPGLNLAGRSPSPPLEEDDIEIDDEPFTENSQLRGRVRAITSMFQRQ